MHKIHCAVDPSAVRALIRRALKAKESGSLIHRLDCVLMIAEGRQRSEDVSDCFGVGKRSVQRWVHAAYVSGIDDLLDHRRNGRWPSLTPQQASATDRDLKCLPAAFGYSDLRWTGKRLILHLDRCFGIKISVRTCQRIIARNTRVVAVAPP